MASEVKYAVTQFSWPNATGLFDVTIASLGWTPKAMKITSLGSVENETINTTVFQGVGFCDGTNQGAVAVYEEDAVGTINSARHANTDCCASYTSSAVVNRLDGVTGTAGPIADGWKINALEVPGTAHLCMVEFFGGADLSAKVGSFAPATTGSTAVTGAGFAPDTAHVIGNGGALGTDVTAHDIFSHGIAYDNGTSVEQGAILSEMGVDAGSTQLSVARLSTDAIAAQLHNGAESWRASVTSFDADGFTVGVDAGSTGGADALIYLLLDIGDRKATVQSINAPTSAASDWAVTGIGFKPQGLSLIPSMMEAADVNTLKTDQKAGYLASSATDGTRQASVSVAVQDAATTTNTARVSALKTAFLLDTADAALFDVGLPTFESDGWTVAAADIGTAQATQRKWLAFAIEEEAVSAPIMASALSAA